VITCKPNRTNQLDCCGSCWVQLREDLVPCLAAVRNAAKRVTRVAAECKMPDVVRAVLHCVCVCSSLLYQSLALSGRRNGK
jgi:hypothetical protein